MIRDLRRVSTQSLLSKIFACCQNLRKLKILGFMLHFSMHFVGILLSMVFSIQFAILCMWSCCTSLLSNKKSEVRTFEIAKLLMFSFKVKKVRFSHSLGNGSKTGFYDMKS